MAIRKQCTSCKEWLSLDEYYSDDRNSCGLQARCKRCSLIAQKKYKTKDPSKKKLSDARYYKNNKAKINAYHSEWYAANRSSELERVGKWQRENKSKVKLKKWRRRARKSNAYVDGAPVTDISIAARWAMWGGKCYICNKDAEATDHVIALAKGGLDISSNLRPICWSCNSRKHTKSLKTFLQEVA